MVPILGYELVYLPVHIVWLELIIHPTAILAFQSVASTKTIKPKSSFFEKIDIFRMAIFGIGLALTIGIIFVSGLKENSDIGFARAKVMVILSVWSASLVIYYTHLKTLSSKLVVCGTLSSLLLIQVTSAAPILRVVALPWQSWAEVLCVSLGFIGALSLFDFIRRNNKHKA